MHDVALTFPRLINVRISVNPPLQFLQPLGMHRGPPIQAREKPLCLPQARVCGVAHNEPLGHVDERANVIDSDITRQRLVNVDAGFNDVIQQKVVVLLVKKSYM